MGLYRDILYVSPHDKIPRDLLMMNLLMSQHHAAVAQGHINGLEIDPPASYYSIIAIQG